MAPLLTWTAGPSFAVGGQFGLELAIDAPWRIEPVVNRDGGLEYEPIPISITFHDAIFDDNRGSVSGLLLERVGVGSLEEVVVIERIQGGPAAGNPRRVIKPEQLREIERKRWISTATLEPTHELCHPSLGEDCKSLYGISNTSSWHAMFWYVPSRPVTPGRDIHLEISIRTRFGDKPRSFRNRLVVHAGEAPLPRFDERWIYGDFHYHSQMTDNEGESGYSYRNVVRTLGAMGLDFVFATDHASGGNQYDGDLTVKRCASIYGRSCLYVPLEAKLDPVCPAQCRSITGVEARDLNPMRFQAAKTILYGQQGANLEIMRDVRLGFLANYNSRGVIPQVYMGEEIDAWPEMSGTEQRAGAIHYGDGLSYPWPDNYGCVEKDGLTGCRKRFSKPYDGSGDDGYLVLDLQGVPYAEEAGAFLGDDYAGEEVEATLRFLGKATRPHPSRQHLVYFPKNNAPDNDGGFVGGETGEFGGAGRRLEEILSDIEGQGVAFLAHPLVGRKPGGIAGPDIVPYSRRALNRAWRSPAVLGLQFWNEDTRRISRPANGSPVVSKLGTDYVYNLPWQDAASLEDFPWRWPRALAPITDRLFEQLYHGAFIWDAFLRKGLSDSQTSGLSWLPSGEARKWFMAGGSDSHGDFNFRREGRPDFDGTTPQQWSDSPVVDTAIGKPRNLVLVDRTETRSEVAHGAGNAARRYGNREVIEAIAAGRFTVTDGPALRIAIDKNRNGRIDLADYQMGDTFHLFPGERVPLLVEWLSSPEFGPVEKIDVYVGVAERTYAYIRPAGDPAFSPLSHGPRNGLNRPEGSTDAYTQDPGGVLRVNPAEAGSNGPYAGIARVFLSPEQFDLDRSHGRWFYLRAFAQSAGQDNCVTNKEPGSCGSRLAYANPIWGRFIGGCLDNDTLAIDADGNGRADVCERDLRNPCPATAPSSGDMAPTPDRPSGSRRFSDLRRRIQTKAPGTEVATDGHRPAEKKPSPKDSCQIVAAAPTQ